MPVINIREIDNTSQVYTPQDVYTVFVPGNIGQDGKESNRNKYTLFADLDTFKEEIGSSSITYTVGTDTIKDPGYEIANVLLSKGLPVLYFAPSQGTDYTEVETPVAGESYYIKNEDDTYTSVTTSTFDSEVTYYTKSGEVYTAADIESFAVDTVYYVIENDTVTRIYTINDGTTYYSLSTTSDVTTWEGICNAIESIDYTELEDKSLYQIRFITNGGYTSLTVSGTTLNTIPTSIAAIMSVAENRGDAIALVDFDKSIAPKSLVPVDRSSLSSKYTAIFTPWCKFNEGKETEIVLPASVAYLSAFANAVEYNPNWYATAGRLRGVLDADTKPIYEIGEKVANQLLYTNNIKATDNIGVAINPITNVEQYGTLIWGNRTALNNNGTLTASSFLNIRQLCCDLKKELYRNAKAYMFEQNTDRLWFNFKSDIESLLENMKNNEGVRGYKIIKLNTSEKGTIKALVRIVPIEAVEKFDLTVELNDTLEVSE